MNCIVRTRIRRAGWNWLGKVIRAILGILSERMHLLLLALKPGPVGWPRCPRTAHTSHRLPIRPVQQWTPFSCTAAVLQAVHHYLGGEKLGHLRAIKLMNCCPDGAPLGQIASLVKRRFRCRSKRLRTAHSIRAALRRGIPVLASDDLTYSDGHAILVTGFTAKGYWTMDPAVGRLRWRTQRRLLAASDEFIAIGRF